MFHDFAILVDQDLFEVPIDFNSILFQPLVDRMSCLTGALNTFKMCVIYFFVYNNVLVDFMIFFSTTVKVKLVARETPDIEFAISAVIFLELRELIKIFFGFLRMYQAY